MTDAEQAGTPYAERFGGLFGEGIFSNTQLLVAEAMFAVARYQLARVSSKEQDMEGFSIAAQQKLLQAYSSGNGLIIEKEFIDVETAKASAA